MDNLAINLAINLSRNCTDAADLLALDNTPSNANTRALIVSLLRTVAFQLRRMGESKPEPAPNPLFNLTADIDALKILAHAAPRFRNDSYDSIDRLDAALFGGDEFMSGPEIRQHFRYYLARWENKLKEYDAFDKAMDGESDG